MVSIPESAGPTDRRVRRTLILVTGCMVVIGGITWGALRGSDRLAVLSEQVFATAPQEVDDDPPPIIQTLTALGYVEPIGEVIRLSPPSSSGSSRIEELRVAEGDRVARGQVVAVLDNRDRLQAALERAQGQLQIAEATLAQVQAGAKQGEIQAQAATIVRLEAEIRNQIEAQEAALARLNAEFENAQADFQRYQRLFEEGAISASERDRFALSLEAAEKQVLEAQAELNRLRSTEQPQLEEAHATLDRIQEIRPVDVQVAAAEVVAQQAAVQEAEAELDQAYLRAPQAGQILKIHTYPGEIADQDGVMEIGETDQMAVVAEVYESDIDQVQLGQRARIYADVFAEPLEGMVERIGLKVERQQVINTDPSENIDARVIEVRIILDPTSSSRVAHLTNLQVMAEIQR